jgi:hypothetical protein
VQGERVSVNFLKQAHILPLAETEDGLAVAMADPLDHYHDRRHAAVRRQAGPALGRGAGDMQPSVHHKRRCLAQSEYNARYIAFAKNIRQVSTQKSGDRRASLCAPAIVMAPK